MAPLIGAAPRERGNEVVGRMLRRVAVILGAIVVVAIGAVVFVVLPSDDDAASSSPSDRLNALAETTVLYGLVLNGASVGAVTPDEVGAPFADVVSSVSATGVNKSVSRVRYEPLVVEVGTTLAPALANWISQSLGSTPPAPVTLGLAKYPSDGAATQTEYVGASISGIEMTGCELYEESRPITYKLSIVYTSTKVGAAPPAASAATKPGASSNACRLTIPKLDTSMTSRVIVEPMRREVTEVRDTKGQLTSYQLGPLTGGDLQIKLQDKSAPSWRTWFNELVVMGGGDAAERSGTLGYWTSEGTKEVARLSLERCGITTVVDIYDRRDTGEDLASMYCEAYKFTSL